MNNYTITSKSPEYTMSIAQKMAKLLKKGDIVILTGELGSGKTKFVEGFLSNFNLQDEISSPTFNIINEYPSNNINIFHFDVYRLESIDEFNAIGGEEYFEKGICLIEWGEEIKELLPQNYIQIIFFKNKFDENQRILDFNSFGNTQGIITKLKEEFN